MKISKFAIVFALSAATLVPMPAAAKGVEFGMLTCHLQNRTNVVLFSKNTFNCIFDKGTGSRHSFSGKATRIGIDLSITNAQTLAWVVFAPSVSVDPSGLEGRYGGVSADASLGVGLGAHVLLGGLDKSFALQPVSVTGQTGIGAAVGIEGLRLKYIK